MSGERGIGGGGGGVGDNFCLILCSGPLTSVEKSESDLIVEDGVCITSLLVLVDRAQVKRGRGKLGPDWASPLSPFGAGGGGELVRLFLRCFLVSLTSVLWSVPSVHPYGLLSSELEVSHWSKPVAVASGDAPSSGSLISTNPSDSHMAPGWSFGELSVLSSTPSIVVSCTAWIFSRGGGSLLDAVLVHGLLVCLLFVVKRLCVAAPTVFEFFPDWDIADQPPPPPVPIQDISRHEWTCPCAPEIR